ncbi:MAG: DUF1015 domain-containing protein [Thermodesulfobacteriota bacterium]
MSNNEEGNRISMAILAPFRGIFYNQEKIGDVSLIVTPPYDVITKEEQEKYYQRHPNNIIRLDLGKDLPGDNDRTDKYTRSADYLKTWQEENILVRDDLPSIYYYQQEFTLRKEQRRTRTGFIALVKLEDFSSGVVLPHEKTMTGPKADRLKLMESCNANLSPIFSLYSDPEKKIDRIIERRQPVSPFIDFFDDKKTRHQLWKIHDKEIIHKITDAIKELPLFIADGHHRYETALNYSIQMREKNRRFNGNEAYNYVMMYLSNMDDDGLVILPTHRLVYNLNDFNLDLFYKKAEEYFHVEDFVFNGSNDLWIRGELFAELEKRGQSKHTFGVYVKDTNYFSLLTMKNEDLLNSRVMDKIIPVLRGLDVNILQAFILNGILGISDRNMENQKNVDFIEDGDEAIELVKKDKYQLVFLMNPTRVGQVNEAACERVRMPQKSTFFYPKLPSGLVINSLLGVMPD